MKKDQAEYRKCAILCVKDTVLPLMKQRFTECFGNMDLFFSSKYDSQYSFQKVIESGKVYEFGYPRCFCPLYQSQRDTLTVEQCECSRQSIIYILEELFPKTKITVEMVETVLGGSDRCRFKILAHPPYTTVSLSKKHV